MQNMELITERYALAKARVEDIADNGAQVKNTYRDYFEKTAAFIMQMDKLYGDIRKNVFEQYTFDELKNHNHDLYSDILPENYDKSYANPAYAVACMGELNGRILSFLYTELRSLISYAYEDRLFDMTITIELFIQIYCLFEEEDEPQYQSIRDAVYWFMSDYSEDILYERIEEKLLPEKSFAASIIMDSDLKDLRYLFKYGEYITDNEIETAEFLNNLSEDKINAMASTYTEGYRIGFVLGNKDLSKKSAVDVRYCIGFERIVRAAIKNFAKLNLKPVVYRYGINSLNKSGNKIGFFATSPNRQYEYDHREDNALYIDRAFNDRRLGVLRTAYEEMKEAASKYAGPAVMEVFGESEFSPVNKPENISYEDFQQKLLVDYAIQSGQIVNEYIKGEERSFTIIAYPIPEIGKDYEEIFEETVKINTLDYELYKVIQQNIIDILDKSESVHILGKNGNTTDLTVKLVDLPENEHFTKFENCLADVNIPLGEVFTSPHLTGTDGVLNVSQVYLNGLKYKNLTLTFKDGMVKEYSCDNFDTDSENDKFIKQNLLYNHDTLPMGEFAIGTNTTAYVMAQKYGILHKLPILIVEKMGPHFAVGDTCYSHSEDVTVYNPNGKEIYARDNEITKKYRNTEPKKAYFNCHTDITVPYDEIGVIEALGTDGQVRTVIKDGRFVLAGTEKLNEPFSID